MTIRIRQNMVHLIQQPFRLEDLIPQPRIYPRQLKSTGLEAIRSVWRVNQYVLYSSSKKDLATVMYQKMFLVSVEWNRLRWLLRIKPHAL